MGECILARSASGGASDPSYVGEGTIRIDSSTRIYIDLPTDPVLEAGCYYAVIVWESENRYYAENITFIIGENGLISSSYVSSGYIYYINNGGTISSNGNYYTYNDQNKAYLRIDTSGYNIVFNNNLTQLKASIYKFY